MLSGGAKSTTCPDHRTLTHIGHVSKRQVLQGNGREGKAIQGYARSMTQSSFAPWGYFTDGRDIKTGIAKSEHDREVAAFIRQETHASSLGRTFTSTNQG
jgi:hypothetical protein